MSKYAEATEQEKEDHLWFRFRIRGDSESKKCKKQPEKLSLSPKPGKILW